MLYALIDPSQSVARGFIRKYGTVQPWLALVSHVQSGGRSQMPSEDYSWERVKHDSTSKIHFSWVFRPGNREWLERCHQWYLHITIWEKLKQAQTQQQFPAAPDPSKKATLKATDKRIDVLFQHLSILDSKFGTLLTLNGLFILLPVYLMTSYIDKTRNS